ncbi:MAG: SDR family oxidoreductase [archaeon]|nr:SDR family oxidoreductase [archaeon]
MQRVLFLQPTSEKMMGPFMGSRLFIGQRCDSEMGAAEGDSQVAWEVSLTAGSMYPNVFGASVSLADRRVAILHGRWDWQPDTGRMQLQVTEMDTSSHSLFRFYDLSLTNPPHLSSEPASDSDSIGFLGLSLVGSFYCPSSGQSGGVVLSSSPPSAAGLSLHPLSRLWAGVAVPDPSLEPFAIPSNPIRWSLFMGPSPPASSLPASSMLIFGSGYFDDSADVPGKPLLFFTLKGEVPATGEVLITKTYEAGLSSDVHYRAVLSHDASPSWSLSGSWENPSASTFGQFRCDPVPEQEQPVSLSACSLCARPVASGTQAQCCLDCPNGWCACLDCAVNSAHPPSHRLALEVLYPSLTASGHSCSALVRDALSLFAPRPLVVALDNQGSAPIELTYQHIGVNALRFESLIRSHFTTSDSSILTSSSTTLSCSVALIGDLNPAYVTIMLGILLSSAVLIPIHAVLEPSALSHCLSSTNPGLLFVQDIYLDKLALPANISVLSFNAADGLTTHARSPTPPATSTQAFEVISTVQPTPGFVDDPASERPVAILFTSGSTSDRPKGAVYTQRMLLPSQGASNINPLVKCDIQRFHPSFAVSLMGVVQVGGRRVICPDFDLSLIEAARPTHLSAPPAFWLSVQREYTLRLQRALSLAPCGSAPEARPSVQDQQRQVAAQLRRCFGNRLRSLATGGAKTPQGTLDFIRNTLQLDLHDLYGSRETGGIACDGVVYPHVEVRILALDSEQPLTQFPARGQIAVHSRQMMGHYFEDRLHTDAAFLCIDGKRFYKTGDVGEFTPPNRLQVLDRTTAGLVKLSQGEWFFPSKIETCLEESPYIHQALVVVHPDRLRSGCILVPHPDQSHQPNSFFWREIHFLALHHRLRAFEIPQALWIERQCSWTPDNGMTTPTFKKSRSSLQSHYRTEIDLLFSPLQRPQEGQCLPDEKASLQLLSPFLLPFFPTLTGTQLAQFVHTNLLSLGADSLTTAQLSRQLAHSGVAIPPRSLHDYTLSHLESLLQRASHGILTPFAALSPGGGTDFAAELQLPAPLAALTRAAPTPGGDITLLTGATGYLGPFVLQALMARSANRIVAIVRASSPEQARARLLADCQRRGTTVDPARLLVFAGDVSQPRFQLKPAQWELLVASTVRIVHSAARVDVTMSYQALKPINVGSTLQLIELALLSGAELCYVSSANAISPHQTDYGSTSFVPLTLDAYPSRSGYSATKAVSEHHLFEASRLLGVPVRVFRPSAICGYPSEADTWNESDFSVLLFSAFAALGVVVLPATTKLHWVPVHFVAQAIAVLSDLPSTQNQCFNMFGDGPTLEELARAALGDLQPVSPSQWVDHLDRLPCDSRVHLLLDEFKRFNFLSPDPQSHLMLQATSALAALHRLDLLPIIDQATLASFHQALLKSNSP